MVYISYQVGKLVIPICAKALIGCLRETLNPDVFKETE